MKRVKKSVADAHESGVDARTDDVTESESAACRADVAADEEQPAEVNQPSLEETRPSARPSKHKKWPQRYMEALRDNGGNIDAACVAAGISRRFMLGFARDNPEFAGQCEDVLAGEIDAIEQTGFRAAKLGEPRLIEFFLKSHRRATYGDKLDMTVTGQIAHLHTTPAEMERLMRERAPLLAERLAQLKRIGPKPVSRE